jgi:hypothetical protein
MSTSCKQSGVAFWATVVVVGSVLYVMSIGPVAWLVQEVKPGDWTWAVYHSAYYPLHRIRDLGKESEDPTLNTPNPIGDAIGWYLIVWGGGPHDWLEY